MQATMIQNDGAVESSTVKNVIVETFVHEMTGKCQHSNVNKNFRLLRFDYFLIDNNHCKEEFTILCFTKEIDQTPILD